MKGSMRAIKSVGLGAFYALAFVVTMIAYGVVWAVEGRKGEE